jgi:hypothetical protein
MLSPAIHTHEFETDKPVRFLADGRVPSAQRHPPAARILYVSSHGWLSGRMQGEELAKYPAAQPPKNQDPYYPSRYFSLGKVAAGDWGFHGPEWIVLAQCSTLNSACWPLWARILERSSPGVHGILAYEEVSPGPEPAARIAENFFKYLDQGAPFLDAWIRANQGQRWAAMVHKDARKDTLKDFRGLRELIDVGTGDIRAVYRGYLTSLGPIGAEVLIEDPSIGFKIERDQGGFVEITPLNLGEDLAHMSWRSRFRLVVSTMDGANLRRVQITAVHIRMSHPIQFTWDQLFTASSQQNDVKVGGAGSRTLTLTPTSPAPSLAVLLNTTDQVPPGLQQHHSYVWFRLNVETDTGSHQHDFTTYGLEY